MKKQSGEVVRGNTKPLTTRKYAFTIFEEHDRYTQEDIENIKDCKYIILGKEICKQTERKHWQSFIYFKREKTFNAAKNIIQKHFNNKCHVEMARGSINDNIKYCSKDNDYWEKGNRPQGQGERTDLKQLAEEIISGKITDEDILINNPMVYHQYGRTIEKLQDIHYRSKYRTEMTEGTWIYGETGTGKSHEAFQDFNPKTHYLLNNDNGWWEGYKGQETVIINDFRGHIPYNELLQLVDKWPMSVKRRGREPMPFTSKKVIITSSLHPSLIYKHRNEEDSLEQLYRRFNIKKLLRNISNSNEFEFKKKINRKTPSALDDGILDGDI